MNGTFGRRGGSFGSMGAALPGFIPPALEAELASQGGMYRPGSTQAEIDRATALAQQAQAQAQGYIDNGTGGGVPGWLLPAGVGALILGGVYYFFIR